MPIVKSGTTIDLPPPNHDGKVSVECALYNRRSVRSFRPASLTLIEISQLLWSTQGITSPKGYRTAPSAGALYPLEVYTIVGDVQGLSPGIFKYVIGRHVLMITAEGDRRAEICRAALHQHFIAKAPLVMLFCSEKKY